MFIVFSEIFLYIIEHRFLDQLDRFRHPVRFGAYGSAQGGGRVRSSAAVNPVMPRR